MIIVFGNHITCFISLLIPHVDINQIKCFSSALARTDLNFPEPYFYYTLLHWPNEDQEKESNVQNDDTYDETKLSCNLQMN